MSESLHTGFLFGAPQGPWARVALNTPVRREFSYEVGADMGSIAPGCRVRVPFGSRQRVGVVVGIDPHPPEGIDVAQIRGISVLLDKEPLMPSSLIRLGKYMSDTTFCSWGECLAAMLPAALRKERARRTIPTVELLYLPDSETMFELSSKFPKQERALSYLQQANGPVEVRSFRDRTGLSDSPLKSLEKKGFIKFGVKTDFFNPFPDKGMGKDVPHSLTDDQGACVKTLRNSLSSGESKTFLLHGVTGSGKTEVYLQTMSKCLEQGRGAIVVVPEISLTPQTVSRFRARFGNVAVLHSGLTDTERYDQWVAIREGKLKIVVGARSALFAPVPRLGMIVVDEEHESSFKQEAVPRYHARDVAQERAFIEGALCVLGSATPSLESWRAAQLNKIHLLSLPSRVAGGVLPEVSLVDMRYEKAEKGHWLVISRPLEEEMKKSFGDDGKAILFLNQRGFSPAWYCKVCGSSLACESCDVSLTFHKWRKKALCHYCMKETEPPRQCPECATKVSLVGVGTERAEDTVRRLFPHIKLARMDRDTMLRRESYEEVLEDFGSGETKVLLGTQMVAKGLDFPDVTVVGVLNADTALHHPDFRASEKCFNLLAQVSGRAGRSCKGGRVVVQTWMPNHPAIQAAASHDYVRFANTELIERKEFGYPPFGAVIRVRWEASDTAKVEAMVRSGIELLGKIPAPGCTLLGPAPPPVEKLKGKVRRQIILKASPPEALRPLFPALYELCQKSGIVVDRA